MTSSVTFSAKDHDSEATSFGIYVAPLTSANLDAQTALILALQTAIQDIILGDFDGLAIKVSEVPPSNVPSDPYAQREAKWRVKYADVATNLGNGSFEIGMPKLTLLSAGTGKANLADTDVAAFVTALEAVAKSRLGNAIQVQEILHVGRNI